MVREEATLKGSPYATRILSATPSRARFRILRVEDQFLHAPVVHVGDIDRVLRRAGDAVDPVELAELVAGLAEHPHNLAVQRQLVYAARLLIRRVEVLGRSVRDVDRP